MRGARFLVFCLGVMLSGGGALAHDARPVVVEIVEQAPNVFSYSMRVPPVLAQSNLPALVWPEICESGGGSVMTCSGGLAGERFALEYPATNPSLATYFSYTDRNGNETAMMLGPSESSWQVAATPGALAVAADYLGLGFEHILGGPDHLLFVLGLLIVAGTGKRMLITVTGFTVAHSITLILSTLGMINVPIVPVEAVIALSILFLAFEISRRDTGSLTYRYPVVVSFGFGLLHGLGFASALGEVGLVANELVVSLLLFNVGVELGQLAFIAVVVALYLGVRPLALKIYRAARMNPDALALHTEIVVAYVIGIPSAYWVIERSAQFLL